MKARTYTLLVTVVDDSPPTPDRLARSIELHLLAGMWMKDSVADAIEGTRPLSSAVRLKHAWIVDQAKESE